MGIDLSGKNLDLQLVLIPPILFLALILVKKTFVLLFSFYYFSFSLYPIYSLDPNSQVNSAPIFLNES